MAPSLSLEGHVTALYGDFRTPKTRQAVVAIRFYLIGHAPSGDQILLNRAYEQTTALEAVGAESLVAAYDACLERILTHLEGDLRTIVNSSQPGDGQ